MAWVLQGMSLATVAVARNIGADRNSVLTIIKHEFDQDTVQPHSADEKLRMNVLSKDNPTTLS